MVKLPFLHRSYVFYCLLSLFGYVSAVFPDAVFRDHSPDAGSRIYIRVSADDSSRIEYCVAAHLNMITEHGTELLDACLDLLCSVVDYNKLLVSLHVRRDGACTHMAEMTQDRVSYIVVMRSLDVVEKYNILQLNGVAYHALAAY